ncbi:hypothetical protein [Methylopila sp. M107]|uniref:DUF6894 family protein n=1 Tax=Methylopila sp. M107 TaxID=1101190 RepID=UPI00035DA22E|nr:hypothetical protein [Methylopila sp. M107]
MDRTLQAQAATVIRESPVSDRYYLHLRRNGGFIEDPEGVVLADIATARARAVLAGREILAAQLIAGEPIDELEITICDARGIEVANLGFSEFVSLSRH